MVRAQDPVAAANNILLDDGVAEEKCKREKRKKGGNSCPKADADAAAEAGEEELVVDNPGKTLNSFCVTHRDLSLSI